jgi:hypothetical protein
MLLNESFARGAWLKVERMLSKCTDIYGASATSGRGKILRVHSKRNWPEAFNLKTNRSGGGGGGGRLPQPVPAKKTEPPVRTI